MCVFPLFHSLQGTNADPFTSRRTVPSELTGSTCSFSSLFVVFPLFQADLPVLQLRYRFRRRHVVGTATLDRSGNSRASPFQTRFVFHDSSFCLHPPSCESHLSRSRLRPHRSSTTLPNQLPPNLQSRVCLKNRLAPRLRRRRVLRRLAFPPLVQPTNPPPPFRNARQAVVEVAGE
jgi:hypothetical protein